MAGKLLHPWSLLLPDRTNRKAREVLDRFKGSNAGGLDVNRIEEVLSRAPATFFRPGAMSMAARQQLLQLALSLADRTL